MVSLYEDRLAAHTNDPVTGVCPLDQVDTCVEYHLAWQRLVAAGVLPANEIAPAVSVLSVDDDRSDSEECGERE